MSDSRENSPDWLRSFQPPAETVTLSSDPEPSLDGDPLEDKVDEGEQSVNESSRSLDKEEERLTPGSGGAGAESPIGKPSKAKSLKKAKTAQRTTPIRKRKKDDLEEIEGDWDGTKLSEKAASKKHKEPPQAVYHNLLTLSSDSEPLPDDNLKTNDDLCDGESSKSKHQILEKLKEEDTTLPFSGRQYQRKSSKRPSPSPSKQHKVGTPKLEEKHIDTAVDEEKSESAMKREEKDDKVEIPEKASAKRIESHVSSSSLPLVLPEKVNRSKALVECDGDSIDLSGDMGAVGRVVISDGPSGIHEMYLDLKGTVYKTSIVPCRTFCVVSCGQSEAKIEAIMNDFIQLKPQSNVYEAETMIEGTLDGFSFDSEDEADKTTKTKTDQADKNEGDVEENGKTKKNTQKKPGTVRKRGKTAGEKPPPPKKAKKKNQASKKGKIKK